LKCKGIILVTSIQNLSIIFDTFCKTKDHIAKHVHQTYSLPPEQY